MKKISIGNLFKKSESGGNNKSKLLILLLILIVAGGAFYWWGYPLLFPGSPVKPPVVSVAVPVSTVVTPKTDADPAVKEKTEFDIEMEKRKKGYDE